MARNVLHILKAFFPIFLAIAPHSIGLAYYFGAKISRIETQIEYITKNEGEHADRLNGLEDRERASLGRRR